MFDVLVPFYNSSKFARIPGEYCIPEHLTGGAAVADYDGDGLEDIYFTVFHDKSVLYKNNGQYYRLCLFTKMTKIRINSLVSIINTICTNALPLFNVIF